MNAIGAPMTNFENTPSDAAEQQNATETNEAQDTRASIAPETTPLDSPLASASIGPGEPTQHSTGYRYEQVQAGQALGEIRPSATIDADDSRDPTQHSTGYRYDPNQSGPTLGEIRPSSPSDTDDLRARVASTEQSNTADGEAISSEGEKLDTGYRYSRS